MLQVCQPDAVIDLFVLLFDMQIARGHNKLEISLHVHIAKVLGQFAFPFGTASDPRAPNKFPGAQQELQ